MSVFTKRYSRNSRCLFEASNGRASEGDLNALIVDDLEMQTNRGALRVPHALAWDRDR